VVILDAQPIHKQRQEYRLVDAATGEFERGYVEVDDMVTTQPWADDLPVHVGVRAGAGQA
jgi:alpha/beta superfamily hydrolase